MPKYKTFDETEVLTKAMNLFWKQGFAATSIQDLVCQLGINRASIYDTFGDKEKLFKKSFELYRRQNIEGLTQFFDSRPDVKDGFRELFHRAIQEALSDTDQKGCFVVNATTELTPNDESLVQVLETNKQDILRLFTQYLKQGREKGQLKTDQNLESLAHLLYTFYNGLRVVSKVRPNRQELTQSVQVALSLLG